MMKGGKWGREGKKEDRSEAGTQRESKEPRDGRKEVSRDRKMAET